VIKNTTIGEILLSYLPGPAKASGRILKALISVTWEELKSFAYSEANNRGYVPYPLNVSPF
jgi:hypothetical protein